MRRALFIMLLILPFITRAQFLSESQLDTAYVFRSLDDALKSPDDVYVLRLKIKGGEIPEGLFGLSNLHVLEMKRSKISTLPDDFARLENLVELDLSNNNLNHIPPVLFRMQQLEVLRMGKNEITKVPEEIVAMKNLRILDLWSTQVPRLPLILAEMESLQEVDLRMIEISQEDQDYLMEFMPDVQFYFSVPCNCR